MAAREPIGQLGRLLVAVVVLAALASLFVWSGTLTPDPASNHYPEEGDVMPNPGSHVGERVSVGGYVAETDPLVIESGYSGPSRFTLLGASEAAGNTGELEAGDRLTAFGTLTDESTMETERLVTQNPWQNVSVLVVSALGGLWVLCRFLLQWRFSLRRLAFVPRGGEDG